MPLSYHAVNRADSYCQCQHPLALQTLRLFVRILRRKIYARIVTYCTYFPFNAYIFWAGVATALSGLRFHQRQL